MKLVLNIVLRVLIFLAITNLFIWFCAIGSGHNIPEKTIVTFIIRFFVLVILGGIISLLLRRNNKIAGKDF